MKDVILKPEIAQAINDILAEVRSECCVDRYEESLEKQGLPDLYTASDALKKAIEEAA